MIVGIVLLVFFLLKRPAYAGGAENFEVTGVDILRYIGLSFLGLFVFWLLFMGVSWFMGDRGQRKFNRFASPTYNSSSYPM